MNVRFLPAYVPLRWHLYITYFDIDFKIEVTFFHCGYTSFSYDKPNSPVVY